MTSKTTNQLSPEVQVRAVRMVLDHANEHPSRRAAATSIATKIGCTPQILHDLSKRPKSIVAKRLECAPNNLVLVLQQGIPCCDRQDRFARSNPIL